MRSLALDVVATTSIGHVTHIDDHRPPSPTHAVEVGGLTISNVTPADGGPKTGGLVEDGPRSSGRVRGYHKGFLLASPLWLPRCHPGSNRDRSR